MAGGWGWAVTGTSSDHLQAPTLPQVSHHEAKRVAYVTWIHLLKYFFNGCWKTSSRAHICSSLVAGRKFWVKYSHLTSCVLTWGPERLP